MGAHLRRPRLQHPRGPTPLPRPKWGRVPRARASLEGGKPNSPAGWSLTNSRASLVTNLRAWNGFSKELGGQSARAFSLHSMLEWLAVERVRTRLRDVGRKGDNKDEFEPVRASRRILRCPQRGQPPARRDVRWPRPSTGEQGGADYGGVGPLSGRATKGRRPGGSGRDARREARGRTRRGPQSGFDHLWGAQGRRRRGAGRLLRKGAAPRLIPAQHDLARRCR